jgi:hypothetical protein
MTEQEWLAAIAPTPMVEYLQGMVSDRKLRLLTCACFRQLYAPSDPRNSIIEVGEKYADGTAGREELQAARNLARRQEYSQTIEIVVSEAISRMLYPFLRLEFLDILSTGQAKMHCLRIRDIFGNPFRPVTTDPAWFTSTVLSLSQQMYESRDFSPMPILADALQDAGCDNADILDHCRGTGPHVRGCHVLDTILGKS